MRKKTIVAGCIALGLALAGCGQSTPGQASRAFDDAKQLAVAAQTKTESSKSAKFDFEMDMMGMKMSGKGAGRFDGANSAMSMTMNMFGQDFEMRMVDKVMYMKLPAGIPGAVPGKPWVKVDGAQAMQGTDQMVEQNDPRKMLQWLAKAGSITKSEPTQLNGQQTTHYWINLDLAKMADQAPGGMSAKELEQVRKAGVASIPMQLWVNQDNLPVRITMDMSKMIKSLAGDQLPGEPKMMMTMNYTDWGAEVDVQAPPANEVGKMPAVPGVSGSGGMPGFGVPN